MTNHTFALLLLFVAAFLVTGIALAVAVPTATRLGLSTGWMMPAIGLLCYVAVFFAGRKRILPASLRLPAAKAVVVLTLWIAVTMSVAGAVVWVLQLLRIAPQDRAAGIVPIWFGCFFVSSAVWRRLVARRDGTIAPAEPPTP